MWTFWFLWLGCAHQPEAPWLAAARIYGDPEELPPMHGERSYFFHNFELEHNAKSILEHPRPEWWDWFPVFKAFSDRPILDETIIESDAEKVREWFQNHGWLDAEVTWVKRIHQRSGGTIVDFSVNYGQRYSITEFSIRGWPQHKKPDVIPEEERYWNSIWVEEQRALLVKQLQALGYAAATVEIDKQISGHEIKLDFQVKAHQLCSFGAIQFTNLSRIPTRKLSELTEKFIPENTEYDQVKLDKLIHRIESTPAYDAVKLKTLAIPNDSNVDLQFDLVEAEKWETKPFAVFASETSLYELGGGFTWKRTHLGQRNSSISGRHLIGYRAFPFLLFPLNVNIDNHGIVTQHDGEVWISLFPVSGLSLSIQGENQLSPEIGFQQLSNTVKSGLRWSPRKSVVFFAGAGYGQDTFFAFTGQSKIYDEWFGNTGLKNQTGRIFGDVNANANWVDDIEDPRNGLQWRINIVPYGSIENTAYSRVHNDFRILASTGPWTVIQRVGAGRVWWHQDPLKSLSLRFFLGGGQTVRGWARRRLEAPNYIGGLMDPRLGGDLMLHSTSEVQYALFPNWSVVAFLDAGRVWESPKDVELKQLLPSLGLGVRAPTPLGVATGSLAYQLIKNNELLDPPVRFFGHFMLTDTF